MEPRDGLTLSHVLVAAGVLPLKALSNLRLAWKLGIGFGLTVGCAIAVGLSGLSSLGTVSGKAEYVADELLLRNKALLDVHVSLVESRFRTMRLIHAENPQEKAAEDQQLTGFQRSVGAALDEYGKLAVHPADRANLDRLREAWTAQRDYQNQIRDLIRQGDLAAAGELFKGPSRAQRHEVLNPAVQTVREWNETYAQRLTGAVRESRDRARTTALVLLGVILAISAGVCWTVTRAITRPVRELMGRMVSLQDVCVTGLDTGMRRFAGGDLTYEVVPKTRPVGATHKDEIGMLCETFDRTLAKIQNTVASYNEARACLALLVGDLARASASVAEAASELAATSEATNEASTQIGRTITQVSSALEESARSSDQMARGATELARTANDASAAMANLEVAFERVRASSAEQGQTAESAQMVAEEGGKVVLLTVQSMGRMQAQVGASAEAVRELGQKQQQIGAIVQTIDEIAEQTNLLALNAAIEAARAGEHGRGFAVVADEVRKLAERSGEATKEIASLIQSVRGGVEQAIHAMEATAKEVEGGVAHSSATGEALEQILVSVRAVQAAAKTAGELVSQMGQSAATVTRSITQVASISQESASLAEELSATNEEVSASAEEVTAAVEEQSANIERASVMAQQLSALSEEMSRLVQRFTYDESGAQPSRLRIAA
jgi:methyl-accepting chemotaxis protein